MILPLIPYEIDMALSEQERLRRKAGDWHLCRHVETDEHGMAHSRLLPTILGSLMVLVLGSATSALLVLHNW